MSKQSDRNQAIKDERDAETAYQDHIEQAKRLARDLAEDAARSESKRAAAAEAAIALEKLDEARRKAEEEAHPVEAKRTFWYWLTH